MMKKQNIVYLSILLCIILLVSCYYVYQVNNNVIGIVNIDKINKNYSKYINQEKDMQAKANEMQTVIQEKVQKFQFIVKEGTSNAKNELPKLKKEIEEDIENMQQFAQNSHDKINKEMFADIEIIVLKLIKNNRKINFVSTVKSKDNILLNTPVVLFYNPNTTIDLTDDILKILMNND